MIEIKDLTLGYGANVVLQNLSASITKGTISAIIGGNGAGKSTLITAIAGVLKPTSGSVTFDGKEIASMSAQDQAKLRSVAQQNHSYWMTYTVAQILRLGHEDIAQSRFEEVAKDFGINEILNQSVTTLSGGQLQRVEIARAFIRDVPIVLLDEPFASQDLVSQERLVLLFQAERRRGRTILLVAHRDKSNLEWCDQIIDLGQ
jgi:ABC-type cobalamin/Fe3+-siderophores transport system ATPase subunit